MNKEDSRLGLIEQERHAYIDHNWGKIISTLMAEYWDPAVQDYGRMTDPETGEPQKDPFRLSLEDLRNMNTYLKRIEMMNVISYMVYYSMYPEDRARIDLLVSCLGKLSAGQGLSPDEEERLLSGHDHFMEKWGYSDPAQFIEDNPLHGLGIG